MLMLGQHDVYDPLQAGSIDGTDSEPHDRAIIRAQQAYCNFLLHLRKSNLCR